MTTPLDPNEVITIDHPDLDGYGTCFRNQLEVFALTGWREVPGGEPATTPDAPAEPVVAETAAQPAATPPTAAPAPAEGV